MVVLWPRVQRNFQTTPCWDPVQCVSVWLIARLGRFQSSGQKTSEQTENCNCTRTRPSVGACEFGKVENFAPRNSGCCAVGGGGWESGHQDFCRENSLATRSVRARGVAAIVSLLGSSAGVNREASLFLLAKDEGTAEDEVGGLLLFCACV